MGAHDNATLARELYEAFNRMDFDRVLAKTAEDCDIDTVAFHRVQHGHAGFREFMQGWKTMAPDGMVEIVSQLAGEEGVTNECLFKGTNTGPLLTPEGEVPATGRSFTVRFCEVWRIRDGKLASLHNYADNVTILTQLGLLPPPGTAPA